MQKIYDLLHTFEETNIELALTLAQSQAPEVLKYWDKLNLSLERFKDIGLTDWNFRNSTKDLYKSLAQRRWNFQIFQPFIPQKFAKWVQELSEYAPLVEELVFNFMSFDYDENVLTLPETVGKFQSLRQLTLGFEGAILFPKTIQQLPALQALSFVKGIRGSELSGYYPTKIRKLEIYKIPDMQLLNEFLEYFPSVEQFVLRLGNGHTELPMSLADLPNLQELKLLETSMEAVWDEDSHRPAPDFEPLRKLKKLEIEHLLEEFEPQEIQEISAQIKTYFPHLQILIKP